MPDHRIHWARIAGLCVLGLALTACYDPSEVPVEAPANATLSGTVTYRERIPLRLDAVIRVRLEDVSLADAPALVLAETEFPAKGLSVPVPFELQYDPKRIDLRNRYAVRAEIRGGGNELLWTTTTMHPVLTADAPADGVEIQVEQVRR